MFVPIPPPPSREARELAGYLEQVIDAYQQDHPDVSANDISRALMMARSARVSGSVLFARILALVIFGGVTLVIASDSGLGGATWIVLGAVILMIVLAIFKTKRS